MSKNSQKISFFLFSLEGGGAEKMLLNLANEFADRGLSIDFVLTQKRGPYLDKISKKVHVVDLKTKRILFVLFRLARYLKREKPAVLISSMARPNIIAVLAKFLARSETKVIVRVANTLSLSFRGTHWSKRWLRKYGTMIFYKWADEIVANSYGSADDLVKNIKIPRKRVKVIYNPTVTSDIFEKIKEEVEHPWLKNKKQPVILGVGSLFLQKDFSTLIKAFARLRKKRNAKLIILGEGKERKKLEKLIRLLGIKEDVDMPGFKKNPYTYMARANVYVLCSKWEGLPNTLIEAMACGTPVVSTDCPSGPAEILENGKYGKLVLVGDAEAMTEAILKTLEKPENPEELIKRARNFSVEKSADKYLELMNI